MPVKDGSAPCNDCLTTDQLNLTAADPEHVELARAVICTNACGVADMEVKPSIATDGRDSDDMNTETFAFANRSNIFATDRKRTMVEPEGSKRFGIVKSGPDCARTYALNCREIG